MWKQLLALAPLDGAQVSKRWMLDGYEQREGSPGDGLASCMSVALLLLLLLPSSSSSSPPSPMVAWLSPPQGSRTGVCGGLYCTSIVRYLLLSSMAVRKVRTRPSLNSYANLGG